MAIEYQTTTLDNGLHLSAEIDPNAHTTAAGFFVKTGTRDEQPIDMGVSHFLEHMMFKGTPKRSADDVNREFDEIGASHNAFTSQEMTAFYAHVLPEKFPSAIDILADIMRPSIREQDFEDERGVILEEIAMYDDQPYWRLYERVMEEHFAEHPLSMRVLGTNETIQSLQRNRMLDYFNRRYSSDNTTLAVSGKVDFSQLVDLANEYCGHWERTDTAREYSSFVPADHEFTIEDERTSRLYMLMVSPGPPIQDDRRYAAGMLAALLGDHEGSLLYWALVDPGLAEEAQAGYDGRDRIGDLAVFASCPPERGEQVEQIINEQIKQLPDLVSNDDLERLRSKTATAVTVSGERPMGRMMRLGRMSAYFDNEYRSLDEELARIQAVTLDDVIDVYRAYPFSPRTIGRLKPTITAATTE